MYRSLYVRCLNIIFIFRIIIFKRKQHKNHHVLQASFLLLLNTSAKLCLGSSVCNSFKFSRSLTRISTTVAWLTSWKIISALSRFLLDNLTNSQLVKKFPAVCGNRRFITSFTTARHLSLLGTLFYDCGQKRSDFRFSTLREQHLILSYMIWNRSWLSAFLIIELLKCTVNLKCRYSRDNWNKLQKFNIS